MLRRLSICEDSQCQYNYRALKNTENFYGKRVDSAHAQSSVMYHILRSAKRMRKHSEMRRAE